MQYSIYIETFYGKKNIFGLTEAQVNVFVEAFKNGHNKITYSGASFDIENPKNCQIYHHATDDDLNWVLRLAIKDHLAKQNVTGSYYLPLNLLDQIAKNVTMEFLGDSEFGEFKKNKTKSDKLYISESRIGELNKIPQTKFDLAKLIRMCEELNDNFSKANYISTAMLLRAILDHIPPIFGFKTFKEVASQHGGKSVKQSLDNLENRSRSISDNIIHLQISKKEALPSMQQVNFSQELDVLLAEIIKELY